MQRDRNGSQGRNAEMHFMPVNTIQIELTIVRVKGVKRL